MQHFEGNLHHIGVTTKSTDYEQEISFGCRFHIDIGSIGIGPDYRTDIRALQPLDGWR
jgi:hypothetical protein